jgi:DNA-binding NarL/FixJ family response regulator
MYEPSLLKVARALALTALGRIPEAELLAHEGYAVAVREGDGAGWAFHCLALGRCTLDRGRVVDSLRWWREAAALFAAVNHPGAHRWALIGQVFAHALAGDAPAARAAHAEVLAVGPHPARLNDSDLVAVAASDRAGGHFGHELEALHDLARLGGASEARDRIHELADLVDGPLARARVIHVDALVAGDGAFLDAAVEALAACGASLAAAEAAEEAAEAYGRGGDTRASTACRRRAAELRAECEGAATPGLARIDGLAPLTKREAEIARLAAMGLASKDIAAQLFVSVRTVDNHLARIYDKLGVAGRAGLADALKAAPPI